jgi:hypothetical protein
MAADEGRPGDPVTFAGGVLDRYRHVCAFVNDPGEVDAVLDPFIRQAIDGGDRMVYIVDPDESAAPVNRLRHLGYDAGALLAHHRAEIRTWTDTYLRSGVFDQHAMVELLDTMLGARQPRIRMMCDMGWAAADHEGVVEQLIEFEARANFIHAQHEHIVICSYDVSQFDGAFIIDVLRTHPMVLLGGILQQNPFFVPPADFLEERGLQAAG